MKPFSSHSSAESTLLPPPAPTIPTFLPLIGGRLYSACLTHQTEEFATITVQPFYIAQDNAGLRVVNEITEQVAFVDV